MATCNEFHAMQNFGGRNLLIYVSLFLANTRVVYSTLLQLAKHLDTNFWRIEIILPNSPKCSPAKNLYHTVHFTINIDLSFSF